jgi:hypothetical protein
MIVAIFLIFFATDETQIEHGSRRISAALRFSSENRFQEFFPALDLPEDSALPVCVSSVFHPWPGSFGSGYAGLYSIRGLDFFGGGSAALWDSW